MAQAKRPGAAARSRPDVVGVALDVVMVALLDLCSTGTVQREYQIGMVDVLLRYRPGGRYCFPILAEHKLSEPDRAHVAGTIDVSASRDMNSSNLPVGPRGISLTRTNSTLNG